MTEKLREVVIGLDRHVTTEQGDEMVRRAQERLPDCRILFVAGATFAATVGDGSDADLIIAATRMHQALYREPDWLDTAPDQEIVSAYDDLQQALKRHGWTS